MSRLVDPRYLRLPNILMTMTRVGPSKAPITASTPLRVPREQDPKLVAFKVPLTLNKIQIRNYLEELYQVEIERVHTAIYLGKEKMNPRTGQKVKTPDYKKAYVRLAKPFMYPSLEQQRKWSGSGAAAAEEETEEKKE